ncbi:uncharacterized protein LY79DRAFT_75090 [Colletotrichum navitas]|uniref:Uncharacterized protein n=1 Tax=Colletotrichum navitas TaxID=681940 RepID=A0AAD8V887_9PEZI|nr:uncharacterized protein LY79DRAFT_75090 [Colletotrichum navitas]KAK1596013.1 hypothetical protein LY79DRAFT_75090 [Colletotrichum navitas]
MSGADAVAEHVVSVLETRPSTGPTRVYGEGANANATATAAAAAATGAAGRSRGGSGALDKGADVPHDFLGSSASPGSTCASARLRRRVLIIVERRSLNEASKSLGRQRVVTKQVLLHSRSPPPERTISSDCLAHLAVVSYGAPGRFREPEQWRLTTLLRIGSSNATR